MVENEGWRGIGGGRGMREEMDRKKWEKRGGVEGVWGRDEVMAMNPVQKQIIIVNSDIQPLW